MIDRIAEQFPEIRDIVASVEVRSITYRSGSVVVPGYVAKPNTGSSFPCVIFNRGGNGDYGALSEISTLALAEIASWGYFVIATQYRGLTGFEGSDEFGGADLNDVLNLLAVLRDDPDADHTRIGMYGVNRGGMMTYLALAETDQIDAAVVEGGISDLRSLVSARPEFETVFRERIPNYLSRPEKELGDRSALEHVQSLDESTPILILHGGADGLVPVDQATRMGSALQDAGHPHELVVFDGEDHGLADSYAKKQALIRAWFDLYVRDLESFRNTRTAH